MPLITSSFDTLAADLKAAPPGPVYMLFSSTEVDGERWCPPCAMIEPDVKRVFENGPAYALAIYMGFEDFDTDIWPQQEWFLNGVPALYRVENGEPTAFLLFSDAFEFGPALDAFAASPEAYETFLEENDEEYVDAPTRLAWVREDYERELAAAKAMGEVHMRRAEVRAAQAAARHKARGEVEGEEPPAAGETAKTASVCTPATCS
ncbi:uncharacterized protein LOC62_03G004064 [Vanrija pseudolonga]|uniref:Thioredoxin domain-containing protein n=1 Tax=Vanrija pseudolonga TaxID=143232 RepID=A0AAF0Y578_9TREE|nr:hypothetical protein LOC62_03G004064 [Vanrija pseudolonga]